MKTANKILILSIIFVIAVLCVSCSILGSYNITKVELESAPNDIVILNGDNKKNLGSVSINFYIENQDDPINASLDLDLNTLSPYITLDVNNGNGNLSNENLTVNVTYFCNGQSITVCPKTIGTYTITAKFTYDDSVIGTISFTYRVVANEGHAYFAGGAGTPEDPYQITNAQELSNIRYAPSADFELQNDIDLSDIKWSYIGGNKYVIKNGVSIYKAPEESANQDFSGVLNGNNKTIKNFKNGFSNDSLFATSLFSAIVGKDDDKAVIKNLTIDIDFNVKEFDSSHENIVCPLAPFVINAEINNVTMNGRIETESAQAGGFVFKAFQNVSFINCVNNLDITVNGTAEKGVNIVSGFVMVVSGFCDYKGEIEPNSLCEIKFKNCKFNGTIKSHSTKNAVVAFYVGYFNNGYKPYLKMTLNNCTFKGEPIIANAYGSFVVKELNPYIMCCNNYQYYKEKKYISISEMES